jgi:hypothetical protein
MLKTLGVEVGIRWNEKRVLVKFLGMEVGISSGTESRCGANFGVEVEV